ncbi:putative Neurofilament medium polypeptide-like 2 [Homarus americanus]|uniref:Putative Neurofilament medium polypeptide-like 2 n=1 Tax=Homarus americanus TaxID=6706 RepID=A0A8J5JK22_HOMAM|nr:putative Neurofilament medium polypeptide-like 2 [Homarus americanus]
MSSTGETSIDELVRETEQAEITVPTSPDSDLNKLLETLHAFEEESTKKLQKLKENEIDRQDSTENMQPDNDGQENDKTEKDDTKRRKNEMTLEENGKRMQGRDMKRQGESDMTEKTDGKTDDISSPGDSLESRSQDDECRGDEADDERSEPDDNNRVKGDEVDGEEDAQKSLAEALRALTSLNINFDNVTGAGKYQGVTGVESAGPQHEPHMWSQVVGPRDDPQPNRVRFDINALNQELANLLRMAGQPLDPRVWEGSTTNQSEIPSIPPPKPAHIHPSQAQPNHALAQASHSPAKPSHAQIPAVHINEYQEYLPPLQVVTGPPPPKPPRVKFPINENFRAQATHLSKSMGSLIHHDKEEKINTNTQESLSAKTVEGNSERKDNVFLSAFRSKGVRERVRSFTKKKNKRVKSLQIGEPVDFKHLGGSHVNKQVETVPEDEETKTTEDPKTTEPSVTTETTTADNTMMVIKTATDVSTEAPVTDDNRSYNKETGNQPEDKKTDITVNVTIEHKTEQQTRDPAETEKTKE